MSSLVKRTRPGPYALAAAGAALAVGLALLAAGGWSQPADADEDALGAKVIEHFAGTGEEGFSGDGGPATDAQLTRPWDVTTDGAGTVYIADTFNHQLRKVSPDGTITSVATDLDLFFPFAVAADGNANVYVADFRSRVFEVDDAGATSLVAGTGDSGYNGDDQPADEAQLNRPEGLAVDDGALFIADRNNHRVRKVDSEGIITTVAGTGEEGFSGDGGSATEAQLAKPVDVTATNDGTLYIADSGNHRVRKIGADGTITTVAGTGEAGFSGDRGPAIEAQLDTPGAVAVDDSDALHIGSRESRLVRRVDAEGTITTEAGTGHHTDPILSGVPPTKTDVQPNGVAFGADLGLLIADNHSLVRQITRVPDLVAVTVTDGPLRARVGDEFSYTVEVANPGLAGDASGVVLTDPLEGVDLVSVDPSQGSCSESDRTRTCELGELAEGATATVSITVELTEAQILLNSVEVTADGDDPFPLNNAASSGKTLVADARCGEVLTEDTTLTDDIGPCPNEGLIAGADGITVDLNGHTVTGWRGYDGFGWPEYNEQRRFPEEEALETLNNGDAPGVVVPNRHDVTVENGTVTGFDAGVVIALGDGGHTVQNLELRQNIAHHPRRQGPFGEGVVVFNSPANVIADNTLVENGWFDGIGVFGPASDDTEITGNTIRDHPFPNIGTLFNTGIFVNGGDGAGGHTTGMQIANNTISDNAGHGIVSRNNFDATIANNVVERHGGQGNGGRGIGVSVGDHLADADMGNTVIGNEVRGNNKTGIKIDARGNKIVNNTSTDNSQLRDHWFDLWDAVGDDCEFNTWNNNKWGSGGFTPDCTSTRGMGKGKNPAADADPDEADEPEMRSRSAPSFDDIGQ